jgi:hypothetical protein
MIVMNANCAPACAVPEVERDAADIVPEVVPSLVEHVSVVDFLAWRWIEERLVFPAWSITAANCKVNQTSRSEGCR